MHLDPVGVCFGYQLRRCDRIRRLEDPATDLDTPGHGQIAANPDRRLQTARFQQNRFCPGDEAAPKELPIDQLSHDGSHELGSILIRRLQMHIQPHRRRDQIQNVWERQESFTCEVRPEPGTGIQGEDLFEGQVADRATAIADSIDTIIVDDDEPGIGRATHVELDPLDIQGDGCLKSGSSILRIVGAGPAMGGDGHMLPVV